MSNSVVQEIVDREIRKPGDLLSPSQVNAYLDCSAKWHYRNVAKLPDPSNGARVRGKAVHALISHYYRHAIEGDRPQVAQLGDAWDEIWDRECDDAVFSADESVEELKASGAALATKYLAEAAPEVEPAMVDLAVSGEIGGCQVRGYIDLVDVQGRVIDFKTASRKPSGVSPDYALQLATYRMLLPEASDAVSLHTIVATKQPTVIKIDYTVSDKDRELTEKIYPRVQEAMQSGRHLPNRGSMRCSRRWCAFADQCVADWGGIVS